MTVDRWHEDRIGHLDFRIAAPDHCPAAETAALALSLRHTAFERVEAPGPGAMLTICDVRGQQIRASDLGAIIDWIEDFHPDHPFHPRAPEVRGHHRALIRAAERLPRLLAAVIEAPLDRDLDIAHYFLTDALRPFEAALATAPETISNLDLALLPLLWRIVCLDREHDTHILSSFPVLRGRCATLPGAHVVGRIFDADAVDVFLRAVRQGGGLLASGGNRNDWGRALGPEGHEPTGRR